MTTYHERVTAFKVRLIATTLRECCGVRTLAAERLGIGRQYIARLVRELAIDAPPPIAGRPTAHRARRVNRLRARFAASRKTTGKD